MFVGLFELVKRYKEDMSNEKREELRIPEEAAKSALCACYFGLLWDLYYIQNTTERDSTVSDVNQLKVRLGNYMEVVQEIMLGDSALLREEAFLCICDILIAFSRRVSFK